MIFHRFLNTCNELINLHYAWEICFVDWREIDLRVDYILSNFKLKTVQSFRECVIDRNNIITLHLLHILSGRIIKKWKEWRIKYRKEINLKQNKMQHEDFLWIVLFLGRSESEKKNHVVLQFVQLLISFLKFLELLEKTIFRISEFRFIQEWIYTKWRGKLEISFNEIKLLEKG